MEINIFCSASKDSLDNIQNLLIPSLNRAKKEFDINLYFIDYTGKNELKVTCEGIKTRVIENKKQLGFGEAHNTLFKKVKPKEFFIILNSDVYVDENLISELVKTYKEKEKAAIVEARQLPFEHPKEVDLSTWETPWASGFCALIDASFFTKVSGFDENFWMYCEDVDLSWRAWLNGYKVYQARNAIGYHYTGVYFGYSESRYYLEQYWGARNFVYLLYKYWGSSGERKAVRLLNKTNYPKYFKEEVLKDYYSFKESSCIKPTINRKYPKEIRVTGFNLYHRLRKAGEIC